MTVNYKGISKDYKYRIAEINFDAENENELKLFNKMCKPLELKGYKIDHCVFGYALVEVEDMDEYKIFVKDYKEIKHHAKLWIKFGI